ncbi:MAG: hypothetical protein QM731_01005 [Chitinophagaceae bacterium]
MKKFLLVLAIGAFVASCNDSGSTQETKAADTPAVAAPDTTAKPVDTTAKAVDTTAKAVDTTKH